MLFRDRADAGRELAEKLRRYAGTNSIVLGLARGGVIVGAEVARALGLPLEVIIAQKIGAPGNPEYAIGAIAEGGEPVLNEEEIAFFGISPRLLEQQIAEAREEIRRRQDLYRGGRGLPNLAGKTVILVDDGIATGLTMRAAIAAVKRAGADLVVVAVPVGPPETIEALRGEVDQVVCLATPEPFLAVGRFYSGFDQVSDEEVGRAVADAVRRLPLPAH